MVTNKASLAIAEKQEFITRITEFSTALGQIEGMRHKDDIAPLHHHYGDGLYAREIFMPAGLFTTTAIHKAKHFFFVLTGVAEVLTEHGMVIIRAPYWAVTEPGTARILRVHEDMIWVTVHATKETDVDLLRKELTAETYDELVEYINNKEKLPCHSDL